MTLKLIYRRFRTNILLKSASFLTCQDKKCPPSPPTMVQGNFYIISFPKMSEYQEKVPGSKILVLKISDLSTGLSAIIQ